VATDHDDPSIPEAGEIQDWGFSPEVKSVLANGDRALKAGALRDGDLKVIRTVVRKFAGGSDGKSVPSNSPFDCEVGFPTDVHAPEQPVVSRHQALAEFVHTMMVTKGAISEPAVGKIIAAGVSETELVDISLAVALTVFTDIVAKIYGTGLDEG